MDRDAGRCRPSRSSTPDDRGRRTTLDLPGRLEAYSQAQLYARVSGYLKDWKADIGAPVKAGQLLAEIDAPDLDQQIMQAEADVASAQANAPLAPATLRARAVADRLGRGLEADDLDQRAADFAEPAGAGQILAGQSRPPAACWRNTSASSRRSTGW